MASGNMTWQNVNISGSARVHLGHHYSSGTATNDDQKSFAGAVLEWLRFPRMNSRQESIGSAHENTFRWLLSDEPANTVRDPGLYSWLKCGTGMYWISGKAGSGKSTLMKLIMQNENVHHALRTWAGGEPFLIASFWFWYGGTQMQRSKIGLMRSMLYDLLDTNEELVPVVFANLSRRDLNMEPDFPTLSAALRRLLHQDRRKICFIIDGIDEYEGSSVETAQLAEMLHEIAAHGKMLVSSRPLQELSTMIVSCPHLKLHDLTARDIAVYVNDRLMRNDRLQQLRQQYPARVEDLVDGLVEKASGVFVWVYLVVRSLLDGLVSHDGIQELEQRLAELPPELGDLFVVITNRIPGRYRTQASRLLSVVQTWVSNSEYEGVPALLLSYAHEHNEVRRLLATGIEYPRESPPLRVTATEAIVKSRCLGLLECSETRPTAAQGAGIPPDHVGIQVQFLHRSVQEFLVEATTNRQLIGVEAKDFDVNVAILNSMAMCLTPMQAWWRLTDFCEYVHQAEKSTGLAQRVAIELVDRGLTSYAASHPKTERAHFEFSGGLDTSYYSVNGHWSDAVVEDHNRPCEWHDTLLSFAIRNGWELYVCEELAKTSGSLPTKHGRPLLDYAVRPEPSYSPYVHGLNRTIVEALLTCGADPNESFNGWTAWSNALYELSKRTFWLDARNGDPNYPIQVFECLKLLVQSGADRRAVCDLSRKRGKKVFSASRAIRHALHDYCSHDTEYVTIRRLCSCPQATVLREKATEILRIIEGTDNVDLAYDSDDYDNKTGLSRHLSSHIEKTEELKCQPTTSASTRRRRDKARAWLRGLTASPSSS